MALLACPRSYWQVGGAALERIGQIAKTQEVIQRADELRALRRRRIFEVSPIGGDQRFASIRQNENELQSIGHVRVPQYLQRLSLERMMRTGNRDSLWKVPEVGSVWWFP
jgi:hypothetical protein